jgi:hypothetical protein
MKSRLYFTIIIFLKLTPALSADSVYSIRFRNDVTITIDRPGNYNHKPTRLIFYALPNGNSTAQTMGKKRQPGDDWHFDIQHIRAQTTFIREADTHHHYVVVYLENDLKSWPAWTNKYAGEKLPARIIDTVEQLLAIPFVKIHLNSHSGGGAFIFDYIRREPRIKKNIERISFIDSDYRYDSSYTSILVKYIQSNRNNCVNVFAYNDSIALLNGKPFVSATGGTWYRTKLMMRHLEPYLLFTSQGTGDLTLYKAKKKGRIHVFLLDNPGREILHTKQVELNGFIHSVFAGTGLENTGYRYLGNRAYEQYIPEKP